MIKRYVLTAVGIVISIAIAVGGWLVTSILIDMESYRLLSGTTSIMIDIPIVETFQPDEENTYPDIKLGLSDSEIVSILRNWELTDYRRSHEPAAGQIDMEQAIESGREGLAFLYVNNILSEEMLEFDNVGAFLSQNVPQDEVFLPLRYSYWTVRFTNDYFDVHMIVNAVTAQVWQIEVITRQRVSEATISQVMPIIYISSFDDLMSSFMLNLEISPDRNSASVVGQPAHFGGYVLVEDVGDRNASISAIQNFAGGNAAVMISISLTDTPTLVSSDQVLFVRFNIGLTALELWE